MSTRRFLSLILFLGFALAATAYTDSQMWISSDPLKPETVYTPAKNGTSVKTWTQSRTRFGKHGFVPRAEPHPCFFRVRKKQKTGV